MPRSGDATSTEGAEAMSGVAAAEHATTTSTTRERSASLMDAGGCYGRATRTTPRIAQKGAPGRCPGQPGGCPRTGSDRVRLAPDGERRGLDVPTPAGRRPGARPRARRRRADDVVTVVAYGDFLCPYCRRLVPVLARLREALGDRLVYVFRHFPNERAHPGAELAARAAEAAAKQGRFWEMHDRIYGREPPITERVLLDFARELGLDVDRFTADMRGDETRRGVEEDLEEGRANGVTGTPTLFVDGVRYDGAWDFYSLLEALERPVAARVKRAGRVFASLPASGGPRAAPGGRRGRRLRELAARRRLPRRRRVDARPRLARDGCR